MISLVSNLQMSMNVRMAVMSVMIMQCVPILQAVIHAPVKLVILEMDSHVLHCNTMNLVALDIGFGTDCVWVGHELQPK